MEKLAKLLSIAAAGCFLCSAAYLYGELSALNRLDIVPYLTFSDFVNFTPTILLPNGLALTIWFLNDRQIKRGLDKTSSHPKGLLFILILLVVLLLGAVAIFAKSGWQTVLFLGFASAVLITLSTRASTLADVTIGDGAGKILDGFLALVFISLVFGYNFAPTVARRSSPTFVCTKSGEETGSITIPFDRGLALIEDSGFRLIPWDEIKGVSTLGRKATGECSVGR